jgi:hypothetical protein
MNFYSLFYWLTVADGVKGSFNTLLIITAILTVISMIGYFISGNAEAEALSNSNDNDAKSWHIWTKAYRTVFISNIILCFISALITVFVPSKKDALIIIAGGAVGNFVTRDSSAKQMPHAVMELLNEKIKAEIKDTKLDLIPASMKDTLKNKSKEELIKILEDKAAEKSSN